MPLSSPLFPASALFGGSPHHHLNNYVNAFYASQLGAHSQGLVGSPFSGSGSGAGPFGPSTFGGSVNNPFAPSASIYGNHDRYRYSSARQQHRLRAAQTLDAYLCGLSKLILV